MIKIIFFTLMCFSLNLNAQLCADRYQTEIFDSVLVNTLDYGLAGGQVLKMDIYTPYGDTATERPVIVLCFGGSFVVGSRNSPDMVAFATDFAKRGYVCASIDYRLASFFDLLTEEGAVKTVFNSVQDGKAAIRYFRKDARNGNTLGVDSTQVFIGGTSAGGILGINLGYVDDLSEMPAAWQTWASEIGGLEGNSGNPGYCSKPSAVFGFAGAVADTSYIDATDVPFYGCHATGDQTVLYDFGPPINANFPVSLYGSGPIETRLNNLGIYNVLDTYSGAEHPPLGGSKYATTLHNMSNFLFNNLTCNPNNMQKPNQKTCYPQNEPVDTTVIDTTNVFISNTPTESLVKIYPNPLSDVLNIKSELNIESLQVLDLLGRIVLSKSLQSNKEAKINISSLDNGIFYIKLKIAGEWYTEKIHIK